MSDTPDDALTELRLTLRRNGYHPVPVSGPRMNVSAAGKRPVMKDWQTRCLGASAETLRAWRRAEPACTNTGLLTGALAGVDIDIRREELSAAIEALARELLGITPLRRIGLAPKVLLAYRSALPFDKIQTPDLRFTEDVAEKPTKVEVLGRGQQFVGFGIHPETQRPYEWPDASPLDVAFADLPEVMEGQLRQFVAEAEEMIRAAGGATTAERRRENRRREDGGRRAAGLSEGQPPDRALIAEALEHIPNDFDYDGWVKVGFALYNGLGEAGRDLWERWSASSPRNDAELTAKKWSTFAQGRSVSVATLFWHAAQNGWRSRERSPGARRRARRAERLRNGVQGEDLSEEGGAHGADPETGEIGVPTIRVIAGQVPRAVRETEAALLKAGAQIFTRAGSLVRPVTELVPAADSKTTLVTRFREMCPASMADHAARVARFERYDARSEDWVTINPPAEVMTALLAREGEWRLSPVAGIVTTPTLRPDGTVLAQPGYDPATRLLLVLAPNFKLPAIPDRPTRADAERAIKLLKELIAEFPFVTPVDVAVALSGMITGVVRGALPVTPLHAVNAHTPGTGKSYLVDLASAIATGRRCPVIAAGKTEEETEKRLGALLREAVPVVSIDNVNGELGGDMLCQMTERPMVRVRILGKSEAPELECRSTVFATGNNLTLVGDMTRRAVICAMDAGVERPELREFAFDPVKRVLADRGAYVAAALTIVLAYRAAGSPTVCGPIGSYGAWSEIVRAPLIWLGEEDPVTSMETAREEDPELSAIRELFEHWRGHPGLHLGSPHSVNSIIQAACERHTNQFGDHTGEFRYPEFRDLLLRQAGNMGAVNSAKLGLWFKRIGGRVVDDFKIHVNPDEKRGNKYSLSQVSHAHAWAAE
ncbi:PriCT-2 domain-containing protein [Methylobacterium sp. ID0610]|uniref:PriCT-2 domain-containing protein n=1 Tax=Methylobacterium carpenticola TaxID=3344827 RepID=UPI0036A96F48